MEAAELARKAWVRVTPDLQLGAYQIAYATHTEEPEWPELALSALLRIAFKDCFIRTLDHPILRQLRGEV
jgi:hypothetical protein